jgi:hypothetical protein
METHSSSKLQRDGESNIVQVADPKTPARARISKKKFWVKTINMYIQ